MFSTAPAPSADDRVAAGQAQCYHCGLANPPATSWHGIFDGQMRTFCCAGCLGIAQTIHAAGLESFYAQRTTAGVRPEEDSNGDEWARWDDPAMQAGVVHVRNGAAEISLLLDGVHCSACTWLIETWLAREPGVQSVGVNYATRRARLVWDPTRRRLSELLRAVVRIGYRAHPYDPALREALARRESRALLTRTAVAVLAMMQVMMFAVPTYVSIDGVEPIHRRLLDWASLTLTLPAILYSASPFFRGAWRDLRNRRLGMDVPIVVGVSTAFVASVWSTLGGSGTVYYDSVTMFIALLLVARYVELVGRRRAGEAIESVARARPSVAERVSAWHETRDVATVSASALAVGDVALVRPGSVVPADGIVLEGSANVEEAMLTGEATPRSVGVADRVLAGSIVRDSALYVRVDAVGDATRLAGIERLVAEAAGARPHLARLADRVAGHFVLALLPIAIVAGIAWTLIEPDRTLAVVFAVLAVSCPCALSLATPAALAAATAALTRRGIVITQADALETLSRVTHVVFDKTGTLTAGRLVVTGIFPSGTVAADDALALAAALDATSEHPVAVALRQRARKLALPAIACVQVVPGQGVEGRIGARRIRLGRFDYVSALTRVSAATPGSIDRTATLVALGDERDGLLAVFALGDELRAGAERVVRRLARSGIATVLLSGDRAAAVESMRARLGMATARGDVLPEDKRAFVAALQAQGAVVAMVGDGINDAPSLAQSQVSFTLGSATPLAQWTADVVVLSNDLDAIGDAIAAARRARAVVRQNLAWAFAYNLLAIPAAAVGLVTPLLAALGMSLSSLVVVGNAMRAARPDAESARLQHGASPARAAHA